MVINTFVLVYWVRDLIWYTHVYHESALEHHRLRTLRGTII